MMQENCQLSLIINVLIMSTKGCNMSIYLFIALIVNCHAFKIDMSEEKCRV